MINANNKFINKELLYKGMAREFTVIIEKGKDGYLISEVVGLPGCHTQAKTMDELMERTKEAIQLYLEEDKEEILTQFIGIQKIAV